MSSPSQQMVERVAAAMPADGSALSSKEIHRRVDMGSPISVKLSLRALVAGGRARAIGPADARRRWALVTA